MPFGSDRASFRIKGESVMNKLIVAMFSACLLVAGAARSADDEKRQEGPRRAACTPQAFTLAFNSRQLEPLVPYLHKDFSVTMVNQDVVTTPGELKAYIDKQFNAPGSPLKDVKGRARGRYFDEVLQRRFGINRGGSTDLHLEGRTRVQIHTRWTGTAITRTASGRC